MFICNHCPYVQAVEDRLIRLAREFEPRGVQFVGDLRQRRRRLPGRRVRQAGGALARAAATGFPTCTTRRRTSRAPSAPSARPDIFVYDRDRRLAYRGRIDDSWKDESQGDPARAGRGAGRAAVGRAGRRRSSARRWAARSSGETRNARWRKRRATISARRPGWTYLRRKGLKTTQQREAIVDAFLRTSGHVALEDLLSSARARNIRGVGLATVYRTVKLLEEAGLAASRQFGSGQTLYELAGERAHHDHLICDSCGFITEFESDEIEAPAGDRRAPARLQRLAPPPRAVRPVREGPGHPRR